MVFEHPGLLDAAPVCEDDVCVTCSDEGRLAEVVAAPGAGGGADVLAARPARDGRRRRWSTTWRRATWCWCTPAWPSPGSTSGERDRVTGEPTGFLYPFIEAEERDTPALLADLAASARRKVAESRDLRASTLARTAGTLREAGEAMAHRFRHGGRLFTFGNGGSATDAEATADLFRRPPRGHARCRPCRWSTTGPC